MRAGDPAGRGVLLSLSVVFWVMFYRKQNSVRFAAVPPVSAGGLQGFWQVPRCASCENWYLSSGGLAQVFATTYPA